MVGLDEIQVSIVVKVSQVDVGTCLVLCAVVIEAAKVRDKVCATDVLKMTVHEVGTVGLEDVKPAVRETTHRVTDVVATDSNIKPTVLVYIAEGRLTIVM